MHALINWFHHLFNPHCEQCKEERDKEREERYERGVCKSCETLRMQLESTVVEKRMLLDAITRKNEPEEAPATPANYQPLPPKHIPWRVKQQILENESRQAAVILKKKMDELNPDSKLHVTAPVVGKISTEDLEKELDLVEEERENNVRNTGQSS